MTENKQMEKRTTCIYMVKKNLKSFYINKKNNEVINKTILQSKPGACWCREIFGGRADA